MCIYTYLFVHHRRRSIMNGALLLLHVFLGAALVAHAMQKLLVFRVAGTAAYLASFRFRAPRLMAFAVIGTEFVSGFLLGLGLLIPVGAALLASTMLVAARTDHRDKGWYITGSGAEFVATNAVVAIALADAGGGRYSFDRLLSLDVSGTPWAVAAAVVAVTGASLVLSPLFRHAPGTAARPSVADSERLESAA
jgi:putative oxidoreductase